MSAKTRHIGISVKDLKEKVFTTIKLDGKWAEKFGEEPEHNMRIFFYGPSGSGKSVEVMKLCEVLAEARGKVLYNSWEEGISKPLQDRVKAHDIKSPKIFFYKELPLDDMIEIVRQRRYQVVVIDSARYMNLSYEQYKKLVAAMPTKILIIVQQVTESGKPYGGPSIMHATDVKVNIVAGEAEYRSRYNPSGYWKGRLFNPKSAQRNLFS